MFHQQKHQHKNPQNQNPQNSSNQCASQLEMRSLTRRYSEMSESSDYQSHHEEGEDNEPLKKSEEYIIEFLDLLQTQSTTQTLQVGRKLAMKMVEIALNTNEQQTSTENESPDEIVFTETKLSVSEKLDSILEQLQVISLRLTNLEQKFIILDPNNNQISEHG